MIDYIHGELTELNPTYAVLEAAGVGYEVNISLPTYSALVGQETKSVKLYVTEIIREDTHDLFGFFSKGERELFLMLMTVSGIGANTARMILSAYSAAEIRQIIATGNARALGQIKGLGPKTAQRIIVDLKDKVLKIDLGDQVYKWRQSLRSLGTASRSKKAMCDGMNLMFSSSGLYKGATAVSPLLNMLPHSLLHCGLNPWAEGHEMMKFPRKPFHSMIKDLEKKERDE